MQPTVSALEQVEWVEIRENCIDVSITTLSDLVRIYNHRHSPRLDEYLQYYKTLNSIADAIRYSCHGRDGKIHPHQHLVGKCALEQARSVLQPDEASIRDCNTFQELITFVRDRTRPIHRFGLLAVYDTSLRLGAYLNLWPELVYLHAGARAGCKALGTAARGKTIEMALLPNALHILKPYQAEDFLCIFEDQFAHLDDNTLG